MKDISKFTEAEIVSIPVPIRASLQDLLGRVDKARRELHDLCQIDNNSLILASLYHELTAVADRIYRVAYVKERTDMKTTVFIKEIPLRLTGEAVEIHRCLSCDGVFGIDASFLDQVGTEVSCLMCDVEIQVSDPTE